MAYIDIEIDKLTHSIENVVTGDSFPTEILPLSKPDLIHLTTKNGWKFDWKQEFLQPDRDVFKLTIRWNPTVIHGLISIAQMQGYVEMYLEPEGIDFLIEPHEVTEKDHLAMLAFIAACKERKVEQNREINKMKRLFKKSVAVF